MSRTRCAITLGTMYLVFLAALIVLSQLNQKYTQPTNPAATWVPLTAAATYGLYLTIRSYRRWTQRTKDTCG